MRTILLIMENWQADGLLGSSAKDEDEDEDDGDDGDDDVEG